MALIDGGDEEDRLRGAEWLVAVGEGILRLDEAITKGDG